MVIGEIAKKYSGVPNRRTGLNKRTGCGIYQKNNKRTGPNNYYTVVPNKSAQGGFFFQKI